MDNILRSKITAKYFLISLLILWNSFESSTIGDEYEQTIEYCRHHLSASTNEDKYFNELKQRYYKNQDHNQAAHATTADSDISYETISECFWHHFFTYSKHENDELFEIVRTTPVNISTSLLNANCTVTTLVIEIQHMTFPPAEERSHEMQFIYDIDISNIDRFTNLKELWITKSKNEFNNKYHLIYFNKSDKKLPLQKLHINAPVGIVNTTNTFFARLVNLTMLHVDEISFFNPVIDILKLLNCPQLRVLSMSRISNLQNRLPKDRIWSGFFKTFSKLIYLNISRNSMDDYLLHQLWDLSQLQFLDISQNDMTPAYKDLLLFPIVAPLRVFKIGPVRSDLWNIRGKREISKNNVTTSNCSSVMNDANILEYLVDKEKMCLRFLCIGQLPQYFSKLYEICIAQNWIDLQCEYFIRIPSLPKLEELDLSAYFIEHTDYTKGFSNELCVGNYSLRFLNFSKNSNTLSTYTYQKSINTCTLNFTRESLEIVDFSDNKVVFYNLVLFSSFSNLKKVLLSGNYFSNYALDNLCHSITKVETLGLARCNLTDIKESVFNACGKLKYLDLSQNHIRQLSGNVFNDLQLKLLNLERNELFIISNTAFRSMEKVLVNGFINLSNNTFRCGCHSDALDTVFALRRTSMTVTDLQDLTCFNDKEGNLLVATVDLNKIELICEPLIPVAITFVTTCILSVSLTILIRCAYMKRYYFKTWFYKKKYQKNKVTQRQMFDCYISYCASDRHWVFFNLTQRLEEEYNFNICIPDRDFGLGGAHVDEILKHISRSHCILVVFTKSYIGDFSSRFDLAVAFEQRRRYGKPMVVIKLGAIGRSIARLDPKALEILDSNDFVEYPQIPSRTDENGHRQLELGTKERLFWSKLTAKLYQCMASQSAKNRTESRPSNSTGNNTCCANGENDMLLVNLNQANN